jgi:carboxypeptidase PM20D1
MRGGAKKRPRPAPSRGRRVVRRTREALQVALVVVVILAVVLVGNALRQRPRVPGAVAAAPDVKVDVDLVARHLSDAIRIRTVSHENKAEDVASEFVAMRALIEQTYPKLTAALTREIIGPAGLLYTWKGSDPELRPALFAAHMDVVPVEPGTEGEWMHPPFDGAIVDGFVWGRGSLDDKASLVCLLEAVESLVVEGFRPKRTIYLAFGADEEVGGETAKLIAGTLRDRAVLLEYVLDEGEAVTEGIFRDVKRPVAVVGTAEKGFVSVELNVETAGGHSSMPPARTAIGILAGAVDRVERSPMHARLAGAPRGTIEALAPYMPFAKRVLASNVWLTGPLISLLARKDPVSNAIVRTTTAPTIFQAGVKENVLSSKARAVINFRILPGDSVDGVVAHVESAVSDPLVRVTKQERQTSEPSRESSTDSHAYRLIETTIQQLFPGSLIVPGLVVGATDSRHYAARAADVYRFAPFKLGPSDLARIHGTNERFNIAGIPTAVRAYRQLLRDGS